MKNFTIILLLVFRIGFSQQESDGYLLLDPKIQFESVDAINSLYNFEFEKAEQQFRWMQQEYPQHPMGFFLVGLSYWWKIQINDDVEKYDDTFFEYMDISIKKGEAMLEKDPENYEAKFFLAAAYGFKARLLSDRNHFTRAAFATTSSLKYLEMEKEKENLNPEFLLGVGLYNYFREWIPENKKFLRPIVMLFPKGDRELGLTQLKKVASESFYTRVEAMNFLLLIYDYEDDYAAKYPVAKYLYQQFPENAVFQREFAQVCYLTRKFDEAEEVCLDAAQKIESGQLGYEALTARHIYYYLGRIYRFKYHPQEEKIKDEKADKFLEKGSDARKNARDDKKELHELNKNLKTLEDSLANTTDENTRKSLEKEIKRTKKDVEKTKKEINRHSKKAEKYYEIAKDNTRDEIIDHEKPVVYSEIVQGYHEKAEEYFRKAIINGKKIHAEKKGNHLYSLMYLAKIADENGNKELAKAYCEEILNYAEKSYSTFRAAKAYLKQVD